ncbi:hypothetical protein C0J52_10716 [Blattella germanica]|nr:hypothetical protein C0J52_10716 [Blattella germanica]
MSKLSFRARALDASKPMPIYMSEELPDLPDYSAINRAVPQMPSGMEKEEECSLKCASFAMEQDIPDYDMDSEDEKWVQSQSKKMDLSPLKFEEMMDRLEKGSGQTVVTLQEAKSLLKEDDDLIIAVYDYWLNKRLKTQHPLIPTVKTEHRLGSAANNPYLAFRRRTEKMQTRKNRKNDETSYEKMLKLRRDLSRAVTLLELVKRREKTKREHLHLTIEIYEKRYQVGDYNGQILQEVSALKTPRPAFAPLFTNQFGINHQNWVNKMTSKDEVVPRKEKRQYKKRKHKTGSGVGSHGHGHLHGRGSGPGSDLLGYNCAPGGELLSSEDEGDPLSGGLGNWPWCSREEGGLADRRYRYCLTSIAIPERRCVGFARRRIGRGGRLHFRPKTPPLSASSEGEDGDVDIFNSSREEPLLFGLPGVDNPTLSLEVETLSDVFNSPSSTLDGSAINVTTTELNLSELLSNSSTQLFEFPSSLTSDENVEVLERLGIGSENQNSQTEDTQPAAHPVDSSRKANSSLSLNNGDSVIGCSKFNLQPSSILRFSTSCDSLLQSPTTSTTTNTPSSTPVHHPSSLHHSHHHHRRRHRHNVSTVSLTSNFLTSPLASTNCNVSGFSNGGLVLNHDPSTSVSGGFSMALPSTSASENVFIRAPGAATTGFGGANNGRMQNLTNGPISTECNCEYQQIANISTYRQKSPSSSSPSPPPVIIIIIIISTHFCQLNTSRISGHHHHRMFVTTQHNYNRMAATSRSTTPSLVPLSTASAAGGVSVANMKQEPGVSGEVTLNSSEGLDDGKDKASNQVCVDKKQLVRKNNSLPMEVT